jgi:hypothetical protein
MAWFKLYKFLFYKIYRAFRAINAEGWEHWKALIVINTLGIMFCAELLVWWIVVTKRDIDLVFSDLNIIIIASFITAINYRIFIHEQKWKLFDKEFEEYSKSKTRLASLIVMLFTFGIIVSLVLSFYCMSQIDWKLYDS